MLDLPGGPSGKVKVFNVILVVTGILGVGVDLRYTLIVFIERGGSLPAIFDEHKVKVHV